MSQQLANIVTQLFMMLLLLDMVGTLLVFLSTVLMVLGFLEHEPLTHLADSRP